MANLDWGYNKHPPLSAWLSLKDFYQIFGNQDWAYYFLSQLFVVSAFFVVFKFSEDFFQNKTFSLISVLLLEGIYFYNFTTPEFNVNVCQLPFWALTVYYCWKGIKQNDNIKLVIIWIVCSSWSFIKIFIYLSISCYRYIFYLSHYFYKKFNFKCLISLLVFFNSFSPI